MTAGHLQRRRQQRIEALCAATLRALGSDARLHYRGRRLWHGEQPLPVQAPHLRLDDDDTDLDNHRAVADGVALRLRYSDAAIHRQYSPASAPARLVFEWLEQLRVESLAPATPTLPGMARNLVRRFHRWSDDVTQARLPETHQGLLLFSVAWIVHSRLAATAMPERVAMQVEHTRAALAPVIGTDLAALRRYRHDQHACAAPALRIAQYIGTALENAAANDAPSRDGDRTTQQSRLARLLDMDRGADDSIASVTPGSGRTLGHEDAYRVFTRAYDEETPVVSLLRAVQIKAYRARLDRRIADQGFAVRRVARRFAAHFARPERQGWSFNEESGYLDGRRLTTLVTSPTERRLFRREAEPPRCDGVVSILLDCSGSMRAHAEAVAVLVDRLCAALDLAAVDSEILGFTTAAWHGGRAVKDWQRTSSSAPEAFLPGRLNERRHLLIKSAEQPWRRARHALGGLLKADLYKEGLDGEALDWACQRLLQTDRQRRVLLVFSDGAPMDTATHQHNGPGYLDEHLRRVRERHERHGRIAIRAVGVGLDLSPFYPRNLPVNLAATLDNALLDDIAQLITS